LTGYFAQWEQRNGHFTKELRSFLELNLLQPEELEQAIATQPNPAALVLGWPRNLGAGRYNISMNSFSTESLECDFSPLVAVCLKTHFRGAMVHPD